MLKIVLAAFVATLAACGASNTSDTASHQDSQARECTVGDVTVKFTAAAGELPSSVSVQGAGDPYVYNRLMDLTGPLGELTGRVYKSQAGKVELNLASDKIIVSFGDVVNGSRRLSTCGR